MKNRLMGALFVLLGLDKETPEERAFRHEREAILFPLVGYGIGALCFVLAIQIALTATTSRVGETVVLSALIEGALLLVANAALKWHQRKYGGD